MFAPVKSFFRNVKDTIFNPNTKMKHLIEKFPYSIRWITAYFLTLGKSIPSAGLANFSLYKTLTGLGLSNIPSRFIGLIEIFCNFIVCWRTRGKSIRGFFSMNTKPANEFAVFLQNNSFNDFDAFLRAILQLDPNFLNTLNEAFAELLSQYAVGGSGIASEHASAHDRETTPLLLINVDIEANNTRACAMQGVIDRIFGDDESTPLPTAKDLTFFGTLLTWMKGFSTHEAVDRALNNNNDDDKRVLLFGREQTEPVNPAAETETNTPDSAPQTPYNSTPEDRRSTAETVTGRRFRDGIDRLNKKLPSLEANLEKRYKKATHDNNVKRVRNHKLVKPLNFTLLGAGVVASFVAGATAYLGTASLLQLVVKLLGSIDVMAPYVQWIASIYVTLPAGVISSISSFLAFSTFQVGAIPKNFAELLYAIFTKEGRKEYPLWKTVIVLMLGSWITFTIGARTKFEFSNSLEKFGFTDGTIGFDVVVGIGTVCSVAATFGSQVAKFLTTKPKDYLDIFRELPKRPWNLVNYFLVAALGLTDSFAYSFGCYISTFSAFEQIDIAKDNTFGRIFSGVSGFGAAITTSLAFTWYQNLMQPYKEHLLESEANAKRAKADRAAQFNEAVADRRDRNDNNPNRYGPVAYEHPCDDERSGVYTRSNPSEAGSGVDSVPPGRSAKTVANNRAPSSWSELFKLFGTTGDAQPSVPNNDTTKIMPTKPAIAEEPFAGENELGINMPVLQVPAIA